MFGKSISIPSILAIGFAIACLLPADAAAKKKGVPIVGTISTTDVHSQAMSPDAVQVAEQLGLTAKLREIVALNKQKQSDTAAFSRDQSERLRDLKEEVKEAIEQTRLEIDFTQAELTREDAVNSELLGVYISERDRRVELANAWGYRTNGVLWAAAEALDIPTYSHPRYSISSGSLGIVAGLVPSAFSLYALRQDRGLKYERKPHPNMLSKVFGYPVTTDIEYPDVIWAWLNSKCPTDGRPMTRVEFLIDWWKNDENLRSFIDPKSKTELDMLTGIGTGKLTIELVSDRLTMIRNMKAMVLLMNRPLLELMMVVRGSKTLD